MPRKKDLTDASFSFEYVSLLLASIEQKHGNSTVPDAKLMSALSRGTLDLTVFAIQHQLRPLRKRINELVTKASDMANSGSLEEVKSPAKKSRAKTKEQPINKQATSRKRKYKEVKSAGELQDEEDVFCDNDSSQEDGGVVTPKPSNESPKKRSKLAPTYESCGPAVSEEEIDAELLRLAGDDEVDVV